MQITGAKLFQARIARGKSRDEVADVADLTFQRIWQLENRETSHININIIRAIAHYLDIDVKELT